ALLAAVPARAGVGGRPGELYQFGAGARGLAMGSAYTAVANDVTSVYYNPAGLGLLPAREVTLMRANLYGGATYDYLGYAQNKKKRAGGWGLEVIRLGLQGADGRDQYNQQTGGFGWSETSLGLAQGWRGVFYPKLSVGVKAKMLSRQLGPSSDRLLGADLGVQVGPYASERLMLGAVVQNALSIAQGDTADKLEPVIRVGGSYRVVGPLTVAADVAADGSFRVGTEYGFGILSVRAGLADRQLTFGGGLSFRSKYRFDLALVNDATLGMSQRFSVSYRFGSRADLAAGKSPKMQAFASEYLANGQAELKKRDYLAASKDIDTALGIDPNVADGAWNDRASRLGRLVKGMELEARPEDRKAFTQDGPAAFLSFQVVDAYLSGDDERALLLAHAADGTAGRSGPFERLLSTMARLTGGKVDRDSILPAPRLEAMRMKQGVDAVYQRRFAPAVELLRQALWLEPQDALAFKRLGSAYFALGDKKRAAEAWQRALQLDPADAPLKQFMDARGLGGQ
ncbi:MAG: tetratricopeptide repeat protein, partial [Elusimicrobia bacterium]|nr:tetratricopeptide repeat protein [Elusimicrobiota bacterium]